MHRLSATLRWLPVVLMGLVLLPLGSCGGDGMSGSTQGSGSSSSPPASSSPPQVNTTLPPAVAQAEADNTAPDPRIVTVDNGLGLQLLNQLMVSKPSSNVAISPLSIGLVLQIIYNGAQGSAATAMAQTMQLGSLTADDINTANAALQGSLDALNSQVQLNLAYSLWQHGSSLVPAFVQINENDYGATLGSLDGTPSDVIDNVNGWISSATQGLIPSALPADFNIADTDWLVINTIYFKGAWSTAFDPSQTTAAPFTRADGTQVSVQMMTSPNESYGYSQGNGFQAVMLPYAQGRSSMLLVLPEAGTDLGTLLTQLTPATLDSWVAGLTPTASVVVKLPKFTTRFSDSLKTALTALGMGEAFGGDFSGISPTTTLSDVLHSSVVQVDENGTVAAGETIGVGAAAVAIPQLLLDHPFFFAIRDNQTGTLLFVGVVQDPTQ